MSTTWEQEMERASFSPMFIMGHTLVAEEKTNDLKQSLIPHQCFDTKDEARHRMDVLYALLMVLRQWTKEATLKKGLPAYVAHSIGGHIFPFGSYRLKVHQRFADIDALCVTPRHVERSEFNTSFYAVLKAHEKVSNLRAAEDAFVPSIKMTFDGVKINLLFARLNLDKIPASLNLRDDALLKDMDPRCVRSLNCYRVTEDILCLVPNLNNYRTTLRAVKLWARRRGVFSNTLGFLDGVSLSMLVAYTCHLYPEALPSTLVHKFFCILSQWKWSQSAQLRRNKTVTEFPFWDSDVKVSEFFRKMRIVTPIFPEHHRMFNMCESTKNVVMDEIRIGLTATVDIMLQKYGWHRLFESPNFFSHYKHYLVISAFAGTSVSLLQWCEHIEKNLQSLVRSLDGNNKVNFAHLNPQCYNSVLLDSNDGEPLALPPGAPIPVDTKAKIERDEDGAVIPNYCAMWFIGLIFERPNAEVNLAYESKVFRKTVNGDAEKSGILGDGMYIETEQVGRDQMPQYMSSSLLRYEATLFIPDPQQWQKTKRPAEDASKTPNKKSKNNSDDIVEAPNNQNS